MRSDRGGSRRARRSRGWRAARFARGPSRRPANDAPASSRRGVARRDRRVLARTFQAWCTSGEAEHIIAKSARDAHARRTVGRLRQRAFFAWRRRANAANAALALAAKVRDGCRRAIRPAPVVRARHGSTRRARGGARAREATRRASCKRGVRGDPPPRRASASDSRRGGVGADAAYTSRNRPRRRGALPRSGRRWRGTGAERHH